MGLYTVNCQCFDCQPLLEDDHIWGSVAFKNSENPCYRFCLIITMNFGEKQDGRNVVWTMLPPLPGSPFLVKFLCLCRHLSVPVFRWKMWCWSLTNTSSCTSVVCQLRQCVSIRTRYQSLTCRVTVALESLTSLSPCRLHHAWLRWTWPAFNSMSQWLTRRIYTSTDTDLQITDYHK